MEGNDFLEIVIGISIIIFYMLLLIKVSEQSIAIKALKSKKGKKNKGMEYE